MSKYFLTLSCCFALTTTVKAQSDPKGTVECGSEPLAMARIEIGDLTAITDDNGAFTLSAGLDSSQASAVIVYDSTVSSNGVTSSLCIVDDGGLPRSEEAEIQEVEIQPGEQELVIALDSENCRVWNAGVEILADYHQLMSEPPPAGGLTIKRWVVDASPHAFYDMVTIPDDLFENGATPTSALDTLYHEFGHTVRHVADGDETHWHGDNLAFTYAQNHDWESIENEAFAFNEGWARYWAESALGQSSFHNVAGGLLDWNEYLISEQLLDMEGYLCDGRKSMVEILLNHPGEIHSLYEFEERYCAVALDNEYCEAGEPDREPPGNCPPGYIDDGLFCRLDNILPKTYWRGPGEVPTECDPGEEYDAGSCYPECAAGYVGYATICYQTCPVGYTDAGQICRVNGPLVIEADNSECPWYDLCGLAADAGCSTCPPGYSNAGCTCNAEMFWKDSYDRGGGTVPTSCTNGMEYDTGLCYPPCAPNYQPDGATCTTSCPANYDEHPLTCYALPNVFQIYFAPTQSFQNPSAISCSQPATSPAVLNSPLVLDEFDGPIAGLISNGPYGLATNPSFGSSSQRDFAGTVCLPTDDDNPCGNCILDQGELCDWGVLNGQSWCTETCKPRTWGPAY